MFDLERFKDDVRKELQYPSSSEFAKLYENWRNKHTFLRSFNFPHELIDFLSTRDPENFKTQDEILYTLIQECKAPVGKMTMYLFILICPFMEIVFHYWRKRMFPYNIQQEEIWNEIWLAFSKTLENYDMNRHEKVGLYFQGKVRNELEKWYRKIVRENISEVEFNDAIDTNNQPATRNEDNSKLTDEDIDEMVSLLDLLALKEIIDQQEKYLIVETKLRKRPLDVVAKELFMTYTAANTKRWRAEAKIQEYLKKSEN